MLLACEQEMKKLRIARDLARKQTYAIMENWSWCVCQECGAWYKVWYPTTAGGLCPRCKEEIKNWEKEFDKEIKLVGFAENLLAEDRMKNRMELVNTEEINKAIRKFLKIKIKPYIRQLLKKEQKKLKIYLRH